MRVLKALLVVCSVLLVAGTAAAQKGPYGTIVYYVWGNGTNTFYSESAAGAWVWSSASPQSIQVGNNYSTGQTGWSVAGTVYYYDIHGNPLNLGGTQFFDNVVSGTIPAHGHAQCNGGSDPNPPSGWETGSITLVLWDGAGHILQQTGPLDIYYNHGNGSTDGADNP
jgi:hypothetical protein